MEEIRILIARATAARAARAEKSQAFGEIVRRFQDLAFACAFSSLGDFHLAQDAAQEAFLTAWRSLDQLRQPEAFPGWLKRVVLTQCSRFTRGKQLETVALDSLDELGLLTQVPGWSAADPGAVYEESERRATVLGAIRALPEHERTVTTLFYIGDYSQNEIAAFLEVPVSTIKKRLFSARHRLRERMLDMANVVAKPDRAQKPDGAAGAGAAGAAGTADVQDLEDALRETLYARRPSRNEQFADTVALFTAALDSFVEKVKQDRYVIAAILFGSLSHDTVWRKSDIDIMLVGRDERPGRCYSLVENGINIHAFLTPRSKFKQAIERSLHGSFMHSSFALSTLLFTTDDTIRAYYLDQQRPGSRDRQMRLLTSGVSALATLAKAEKWLVTRQDLPYCVLWIMRSIQHLATMEVLLRGELTTREVVPQALQLNPDFFGKVYRDLILEPKDAATIQEALDLINAYLDERVDVLFGPVLAYLREQGGIRTTTELDAYFSKQVQTDTLCVVYEWLADKGIIQKVPSPVRLTPKSQVVVDEAAYYCDGLDDESAGITWSGALDRISEEAGSDSAGMEAARR